MSIRLTLDPASVDGVVDYVQQTRERILQAVRDGMLEAMQGLSGMAIDEMEAAGIQNRTFELAGAIAQSPHVSETAEVIRGTVSADVGAKHIGLWLEEGHHVGAVEGKLFMFTEPDGQTFFTRGHKAFDVKPHPFLNPALHAYETTIDQIIRDAIEGAISS